MPVKTDGELYDGTPLNGAADLRTALVTRSDVVVTHFTEMLMSYALGRRVEYYDMPAIRRIVRDAKAHEYRMSDLILGRREESGFHDRCVRDQIIMLTKKHISRRTALKGLGVGVALPFLDAMVPAGTVFAGVGLAEERLADEGHLHPLAVRLDGGAQAGPARPDHDHVVLVGLVRIH